MTERLFNQESEVAILSIILNNPSSIYDLTGLKSFMFTSSVNRLLFSELLELTSTDLIPEYNLVITSLESSGKLKDVGGKDYLEYLKNQTYALENMKEFERILINDYKARSLISIGADLSSHVVSTKDIDSVISSLRTSLDNLTDINGGDSTADFTTILRDSWGEIVEKAKNPGMLPGISFGIKPVDAVSGGIGVGDEWVIAGRPSMGKSAILCNSALETAKLGNPVLLFSLEMRKQMVAERLLALDSGVSISDMRLGLLDQMKLDLISDSIKRIKSYPIYVDCNFSGSLEYILSTIRKYKKNKGIRLAYLDYIQLLATRDEGQTMELGRISRALKLLAGELEIGTVILSQLSRAVELRDDKRPILSDLRQSGNLEEDPDVVAFLYRDEYYNKDKSKYPGKMEFIVRKFRNGEPGTLILNFDGPTNKITGG